VQWVSSLASLTFTRVLTFCCSRGVENPLLKHFGVWVNVGKRKDIKPDYWYYVVIRGVPVPLFTGEAKGFETTIASALAQNSMAALSISNFLHTLGLEVVTPSFVIAGTQFQAFLSCFHERKYEYFSVTDCIDLRSEANRVQVMQFFETAKDHILHVAKLVSTALRELGTDRLKSLVAQPLATIHESKSDSDAEQNE
jgi:hypothetical protein